MMIIIIANVNIRITSLALVGIISMKEVSSRQHHCSWNLVYRQRVIAACISSNSVLRKEVTSLFIFNSEKAAIVHFSESRTPTPQKNKRPNKTKQQKTDITSKLAVWHCLKGFLNTYDPRCNALHWY